MWDRTSCCLVKAPLHDSMLSPRFQTVISPQAVPILFTALRYWFFSPVSFTLSFFIQIPGCTIVVMNIFTDIFTVLPNKLIQWTFKEIQKENNYCLCFYLKRKLSKFLSSDNESVVKRARQEKISTAFWWPQLSMGGNQTWQKSGRGVVLCVGYFQLTASPFSFSISPVIKGNQTRNYQSVNYWDSA